MSLVFIIEDDQKIAELLRDYLVKDGYDVELLHTGENAISIITQKNPDLIVLDNMLPGMDGFEICRRLREMDNLVPVLMLTACIDDEARLRGFNVGADDYVCKPHLPPEIVARVNAILRRSTQSSATENAKLINYRDIALDTERYCCFVNGSEVELTAVEFRLLHALVTRPKRILTRDFLMDVCYDDGRIINERTIDSHMRNLRKKLAQTEASIETVYSVGYKFE